MNHSTFSTSAGPLPQITWSGPWQTSVVPISNSQYCYSSTAMMPTWLPVIVFAPSLEVARLYARMRGIRMEEVLWGDRDLPIEHLDCRAYELVKLEGWERDKSRAFRERVETWGMSLEEARWHLQYGKNGIWEGSY